MSGRRETWVFLRGLMRESGHWGNLLDDFHIQFPDRNIVPVDVPGTGSLFQENSFTSIEEMTEFVRRKVYPVDGPIKVFAISLGGMIASDWIHRYPDEVSGAVLVNTSFRGFSSFFARLRFRAVWILLRLVFARTAEARERLVLKMVSNLKVRDERVLERWVEIQKRHPARISNVIRQLWAAARFNPPREKPQAKVLILGSENDQMVNVSCSKAIAARWGAPILLHPTSGHDLALDDPKWVLNAIRGF